jgi:CPA2 family monovalent cation:H+ antiporter-2
LGGPLIAAVLLSALLIFNSARLLGISFGLTEYGSFYLAAMLMICSSAVVAKVLQEMGRAHQKSGQLAMAVIVLEDIVAILMIALLGSLGSTHEGGVHVLFNTLGSVSAFTIAVIVLAILLVPRVFRRLNKATTSDVQATFLVGALLMLALFAARLGYSLALGAVLLGAAISGTRYRSQVEHALEGMRSVFTAIFFVSIGMLFDIGTIPQTWPKVLLLTAAVIIARPLVYTFSLLVAGRSLKDAIQTSLTVTPIGEFSFIIAQMGVNAGVLPKPYFSIAVAFSLLTALICPILIRKSCVISNWLEQREPEFLKKWLAYYQGWLRTANKMTQANLLWKFASPRVMQLGLQVLFLAGVMSISNYLSTLISKVSLKGYLFRNDVAILFSIAFGIILLIPAVSIWRNISALSLMFADVTSKKILHNKNASSAVEGLIKFFLTAPIVLLILNLRPFGITFFQGLFTIGIVLIVLSIVFWRKIIHLHSRIEYELSENLKNPDSTPQHVTVANRLLRKHDEWNLELREIPLPDQADCVGMTLQQADLRARTGCTIVSIDRQGFIIPNPTGQQRLFPRDILLLLGSEEQLLQAETYLNQSTILKEDREIIFHDTVMETIVVEQNAIAAGRSLQDLELSNRFGIFVIGIKRAGHHVETFDSHFILQAGDELLLLGTTDAIDHFVMQCATSITEVPVP